MVNTQKKNKRFRVYVDPEVQLALGRRVALHWIFFMIVCFVLISVLQAFIENPSTNFSEMFIYAFRRNVIGLASGIALIPFFIYDTMQVTNRFAGPIVRLRENLRSIAAGGEVTDLKIREGDYWQELAVEYNAAVQKLTEPNPTSASPAVDSEAKQLEPVG